MRIKKSILKRLELEIHSDVHWTFQELTDHDTWNWVYEGIRAPIRNTILFRVRFPLEVAIERMT